MNDERGRRLKKKRSYIGTFKSSSFYWVELIRRKRKRYEEKKNIFKKLVNYNGLNVNLIRTIKAKIYAYSCI